MKEGNQRKMTTILEIWMWIVKDIYLSQGNTNLRLVLVPSSSFVRRNLLFLGKFLRKITQSTVDVWIGWL